MKKSSVLVTLFLVVALIFAVSCPDKNPSINVTTESSTVANIKDGDLTLEVKIALANDTFNTETVKDGADVSKWVKSFKDSTNIVKANVKSAKVKASSVNSTKDEVVVTLVVEPKVVTAADNPVKIVFEIPEAKETSDTVWTTSKKAVSEAKSNTIAITVVDKEAVTAAVGGGSVEFTAGTEDTTGKKVTVTLTGGTFASTKDIAVVPPNGAVAAHLTYAYDINASDKKILNITVKATKDIADADKGTYKINIPASAITPDNTHIAKALSENLTVTVTTPTQEISVPTITGTVAFTEGSDDETGKKVTITVTNAKFVAAKLSGITATKPTSAAEGHITFSSFTPTSGSETSVEATVTCSSTVATTDAGNWTIKIPADAITPNAGYTVPTAGFSLTQTVSVN